MYKHKKPRNLHIAAYEGIDTSGKTTSFTAVKIKLIQQNYIQQISKGSLIRLTSKYELPLQIEGTPLYDDYSSFFIMDVGANETFFTTELEASKEDFYINAPLSDCIVKLFLTLPHKGVPSYINVRKVLEADENIPKRQESRFRTFVINYHESMKYVFDYMKSQPTNYSNPTVYILYTDRSWISNFVYNGYTGDIENEITLLKKVQQAGYHPLDLVNLFVIDKTTLYERMQQRVHLSYYEKYGIDRLMKLQEKYLYLVTQLHKIGYIKEYAIINKTIPDIKTQQNYTANS